MTCVAFSIKFANTNEKIAENSEICKTYSVLFNNSILFIRVLRYEASVIVWDWAAKARFLDLSGLNQKVVAMDFTDDGRFLCASGQNQTMFFLTPSSKCL